MIDDELRSKVNPPTFQKPGVAGPGEGIEGVPELKIHGAAIITLVPGLMPEKSPESCRTNELFHVFTAVAVASDIVSKVTTPPKSMFP